MVHLGGVLFWIFLERSYATVAAEVYRLAFVFRRRIGLGCISGNWTLACIIFLQPHGGCRGRKSKHHRDCNGPFQRSQHSNSSNAMKNNCGELFAGCVFRRLSPEVHARFCVTRHSMRAIRCSPHCSQLQGMHHKNQPMAQESAEIGQSTTTGGLSP